jgi:hypothetical protein
MSIIVCLEQELEETLTDLLREDYGDELEDIEDIDDLLAELYDSFHCDFMPIAQNYFRFSIPNLTKEIVQSFVENHEPEEEDDEDVE